MSTMVICSMLPSKEIPVFPSWYLFVPIIFKKDLLYGHVPMQERLHHVYCCLIKLLNQAVCPLFPSRQRML